MKTHIYLLLNSIISWFGNLASRNKIKAKLKVDKEKYLNHSRENPIESCSFKFNGYSHVGHKEYGRSQRVT